MAIFKCKMCGGDLNVSEGVTVAECEYCGTKQTVSCSDDEKRINLYNRANRLRINSEFDKAANIYESIVAEFPEEAEAYWGLVICNYGIEYVDDPVSAKKIPTCHRASFESIQNDENYKLALEYADVNAQKVYRDEAREIDRIREEILAISKAEKPYDIFICYKETDDKGERTIDSVIAQDVYDALSDKGYKVFFSRISLEDKLGRQYEPYIFAALNSAKVMLSFGTKYEYFHAVWVKNEWSRFLKLMAKDKSKVLIPCYKDMDAYDMPEEFKALQAQDMGKVGAIQDLVRGIGKIIEPKESNVKDNASSEIDAATAPLLKRVFMFLEDGDFKSANEYCEKVLDINPECASGYLGKLMVEKKVRKQEKLSECAEPFYNSDNYQKILRFGDTELAEKVKEYCDIIESRKQKGQMQSKYENACNIMNDAKTAGDYIRASEIFSQILNYKDSAELHKKCQERTDYLNKESAYSKAESLLKYSTSIDDIKLAERILSKILYFKEATQLVENDCKKLTRVYELGDLFQRLLNESDVETEAEKLTQKINGYKQEQEKLLHLVTIFDVKYHELQKIEANIADYKNLITQEDQQKHKRNSSVDYHNEIDVLTAQKNAIRNQIGRYNSVSEINAQIDEYNLKIKETQEQKEKIFFVKTGDIIKSVADLLISDTLKPYVTRTPYVNYVNKINIIKLFANRKVGDVITFGRYQGTDLCWQVLDKKDDALLIMSAECLDCVSYSNWAGDASWSKSTVRGFLNLQFLKDAFSNSERAIIVERPVSGSKNPVYEQSEIDSTQDKVFLLSVEELEKYLTDLEDRKVQIIPYLKRKLPFDADKCRWWLRTMGKDENQVVFVDSEGNINYEGDISTAQYNTIRPALWIDKKDIEF